MDDSEYPHPKVEIKYVHARGRMRAILVPGASAAAKRSTAATSATARLSPMLVGTLDMTYGPSMGVGGQVELGIWHGADGVTTTAMHFPNGHEMTVQGATVAAPPSMYICQVADDRDWAMVVLRDLLRFIRSGISLPFGRPRLGGTH